MWYDLVVVNWWVVAGIAGMGLVLALVIALCDRHWPLK